MLRIVGRPHLRRRCEDPGDLRRQRPGAGAPRAAIVAVKDCCNERRWFDDVQGVMSVPDEIDDLIGALRSPALASELVDEKRSVAAMAGAFQSAEGKTNMHSTSRRARIGVLIATGIIGFGGVAAAGPGGVFDADADEDVVGEATTTTEAVDASTTIVEVTTTDDETLPRQRPRRSRHPTRTRRTRRREPHRSRSSPSKARRSRSWTTRARHSTRRCASRATTARP